MGKKSIFLPETEEIKQLKTKAKLSANTGNYVTSEQTLTTLYGPSITTQFKGNIFNGGVPPDNTIAVSNNGNVVSVINCNIAYYTAAGVQTWAGSFWELYNDPSLTEIIYDPIVMYDSQQDRFVMIAIHGFTSVTSKLIISFSKSNNPQDGWWTYKLSGNPLNNSCWLDYPKLGISNNEIYVTGNLFGDGSGFSEAIIFQIKKSNGFEGTNLQWITWTNIAGSPSTIIPASYGQQGNYGPGLYFVNQSPGRGNAVNIYELTNDLSSSPQLTRRTIFKADYGPSGYAQQSGTPVQLITGDCRILNAFYLDGHLHYVFQSDYQNTNYTGINYNRINLNAGTNVTYTYGEIGFDCAYPSVASFGISEKDKSVVFAFLRSGPTIFPETRVIILDSNAVWSDDVLVKAGENFVDAFQQDNLVRWGDYSGIAYRYTNQKPEVWISGCYGSTQRLFNTTYKCLNTWIAQVTSAIVSGREDAVLEKPLAAVYPNPAVDLFTVRFTLNKVTKVNIQLFDISGKSQLVLFNGLLKSGDNVLTFNRNALKTGLYQLQIADGDQVLYSEKMLIK